MNTENPIATSIGISPTATAGRIPCSLGRLGVASSSTPVVALIGIDAIARIACALLSLCREFVARPTRETAPSYDATADLHLYS